MSDELIQKTAAHVRQILEQEEGSHDWWHTYRVWQTALKLAQENSKKTIGFCLRKSIESVLLYAQRHLLIT